MGKDKIGNDSAHQCVRNRLIGQPNPIGPQMRTGAVHLSGAVVEHLHGNRGRRQKADHAVLLENFSYDAVARIIGAVEIAFCLTADSRAKNASVAHLFENGQDLGFEVLDIIVKKKDGPQILDLGDVAYPGLRVDAELAEESQKANPVALFRTVEDVDDTLGGKDFVDRLGQKEEYFDPGVIGRQSKVAIF